MSDLRPLKIFLSSPGDVTDERLLAQEVIDQLLYDPTFRGKIFLEVVAWDKTGAGAPMLATKTPQEAINDNLTMPSACEIVVVILSARMGTPLGEEYRKPEAYRYPTTTSWEDWRYLSGTEWEFVDALEKGTPHLLVYRCTEPPALKLDDPDFDAKREQWKHVEAFFKAFKNPDGSIRRGYNPYAKPADFRRDFESHLRLLLSKILEKAPTQPPNTIPAKPLWEGSPFPGLRAFTHADAPIFFGRDKETDDLIERLNQHRFVAVVGASGSGKSSLVWAGVLPRLEANAISSAATGSKDWRWLRLTPGGVDDNPFMALAIQLEPYLPGVSAREMADKLTNNPASFSDTVAQVLQDKPVWAELLLFIDQFEELVTLADPIYRPEFAELLYRAVQSERVRVVVTLRADFYHQLIPVHGGLVTLLQKGSYPLGAPDAIALYEMIVRPAERAGLQFEDDLARVILRDTGTEPGSLALLAYLLDELYQVRTADGQLTKKAYTDLGGVQGAIGKRAESIFNRLDAEAQASLPRVFHVLVEVDERGTATRQRAPLTKVAQTPASAKLVDAFTNARLLVQDAQNEVVLVEVAHEALLRNWQRLANWIEQTQDDLRLLRRIEREAQEWERKDKPEFMRPPHEELSELAKVCERLGIRLDNPLLIEFTQPEQVRLLRELEDPDTIHLRRRDIGERLCVIGDTRHGIGLGAEGLPEFEWCLVSIGDKKTVDVAIENIGNVSVNLPFSIGKYPITYAQFEVFLDTPDGYMSRKHDWFKGLTANENDKTPSEQFFRFDNHPCVRVNWYEAVAFCRWLSAQYGGVHDLKRVMEWKFRLPTESEWQVAATGGSRRNAYPWGAAWDERFANTKESSLARTVAVGMYPMGAAECGAMDMAGNQLEWTLTEHQSGEHQKLDNENARVMRGGSWLDKLTNAHTTYRGRYTPDNRSNGLGFRLVCVNP